MRNDDTRATGPGEAARRVGGGRVSGRPNAALRAVASAVAMAAALAGAAACGSGSESAGSTTGDTSAARGKAVYAEKCAVCHGDNLQGTDRGPSHLSKVYEPGHHSDESFRRAVREGSPQHHWRFGPMPPVPGVSDTDLTAVIAFVRAEQRTRGLSD